MYLCVMVTHIYTLTCMLSLLTHAYTRKYKMEQGHTHTHTYSHTHSLSPSHSHTLSLTLALSLALLLYAQNPRSPIYMNIQLTIFLSITYTSSPGTQRVQRHDKSLCNITGRTLHRQRYIHCIYSAVLCLSVRVRG